MFHFKLFSIVTLTVLSISVVQIQGQLNPPQNLTTPELCARDNYPYEIHTVTTQDGYILTIHRITGSPLTPTPPGTIKPVVLLQHGLLASSSIWLINAPDKRLGYLLADFGYDVWMGNFRGNFYSRAHVTLSPSNPSFWQFTYHQMGIYDLPSSIDYILANTTQSTLSYIGHSMGTTAFFVMASLNTTYNAKINAMIALAPVAYTANMESPLRIVAKLVIPGVTQDILAQLSTSGTGEYSPNGGLLQQFKQSTCQSWTSNAYAYAICVVPNFVQYGFDCAQVNYTTVPDNVGHFPQGSSVYTVIHQAQGVNNKLFAQYDYGLVQNLLTYKSITPPKYPLSKITAPLYLISGKNDWLADPADVTNLVKNLPTTSIKLNQQIEYPDWNHGDFVTSCGVNYYLHPTIFNMLATVSGLSRWTLPTGALDCDNNFCIL